MNIAAITKFKHGTLYRNLVVLGWSQKQLADRMGVSQNKMSKWINLKSKPNRDEMDRLQRVFGEEDIYFDPVEEWPEDFSPLPNQLVQLADVSAAELERLAYHRNGTRLLEDPAIRAFESLDRREQLILLDKADGKTYGEICKKWGITPSRAAQIGLNGVHKIRAKVMWGDEEGD
jgi:transcriptional regulator with XRE-family HTH domain